MNFPKLFRGKLLKRYKRFLADVELENGEVVTAHVPNSGAMTACITPLCEVALSYHDNPKRKLKYTLELTKPDNSWICTNTMHANKIAIEAIENGFIKELQGYESLKPEQKYGKSSRIDILLEKAEQKCYVEIKSVTLKIEQTLAFPDAVTTRGQKHLQELEAMVQQGHRAVMLYVCCRNDANSFRIAKEVDATYDELLVKAMQNGVEVLVYGTNISPETINIDKSLEFCYNCAKKGE